MKHSYQSDRAKRGEKCDYILEEYVIYYLITFYYIIFYMLDRARSGKMLSIEITLPHHDLVNKIYYH